MNEKSDVHSPPYNVHVGFRSSKHKCLLNGIEFGQNEFSVMRYVKSRISAVTNIHSGHVTMAAIETILV